MLDKEIDDVAQSMTALPADPAFAARVSMRIADARERRTIWTISPGPWLLAPIAAACVLVLAVFVARQGSVRLKPDAAPAVAPAVERAFQARGGGDPERVALQQPRSAARPLPDLPPAAIAPIDVGRVDVQPIVEMSAIDINPIAIDRIDISAMP